MANVSNVGSTPIVARGAPEPDNYNKDVGFEHPDARVDDDFTQAAKEKGGYSAGVARDVGAIEIQFDRMATLQIGDDYMVPGWVAQNGMDPNRASEVRKLLDQVGQDAGLDPAMINEVQLMYNDGIGTQNFAKEGGNQPYGQRPMEYGSWQNTP